MTIDELARRAGSTSRNVRAYQERGLLPPPEKVGRTGWYDQQHLARINLITHLLARGFSLAAIASLLEAWEQGGTLADVLGFEEAVGARYELEDPQRIDGDELARRLPGKHPTTVFNQALEAGLLEIGDDDRLVATSPRLLDLAEVLHHQGIPVDALTEEAVRLRREMDAVAERFLGLFERHVWEPFVARGAPAEELPMITRALEALRPVPGEATAIFVAQAMTRRARELADGMIDVAAARQPEQP